jgi:DNA-nicking Smr family endonuclease
MGRHWVSLEKFEPSDSRYSLEDQPEDQPEEKLFERAMADVHKLERKSTVPRRNGPRRHLRDTDSTAEGRALLKDFLEGRSEFEWSFHPGYQEGGPEQSNRQLLKKLHKGGFSVQAELDLHGLSQSEAQQRLDEFLYRCSRRNIRCVRIVHGKGNNSQNHEGVLKKRIPMWLATRRLSRLIIAYTSAPPSDGGIGATYILLRKRTGTDASARG